jgi:hypothetical protein
LVDRPDFASELTSFYYYFLETCDSRLNPLSFVKMAVVISRQQPRTLSLYALNPPMFSNISAADQAIEFLKRISEKVHRICQLPAFE